jgi:MFS family permease
VAAGLSLARSLRRLAVDVAPLRESRDFRLLWSGELVSQVGHQFTTVALLVQVFDITGSTAAVGAIGLVQLVPMVVASLGIGPVIDARDRRRVLIAAQVGLAAASSVLFGGALAGDPPLALLYVAAALNAGLTSVVMPTRAAVTPNVVRPEQLAPALALNQVMWTSAAVVGPGVGGLVVVHLGFAWAYGIDVATYGVALVCAWALRPQRPRRDGAAPAERGWEAALAGVRYLRGRPVLQSTFTVDVVAMVFGMPRALFPVLARERFGGGGDVVGWLLGAIAAGALVGAVTSGWVGRVRRQGLAIMVAVTVWGAGIVGFGVVGDNLPLALAFLALAGGADVVSAVFRSTIQQSTVPDALRGRLSSFNILVVAGGPRLGDFEAGAVAAAFTPTVSVVSGGVLCIAGVAVMAALVPRFARWQVGDPP